jgi:hypothetical protein
MLKKITDEKQKPLVQVLTEIRTTFFRTHYEKKKGKWVYVPKEQYLTR